MAWTSAILWIAQACHSGAMAPPQDSRLRRVPADPQCIDLYDYVATSARPDQQRARRDAATWTVADDWPTEVPVTEAEIDVFEAWFGDLFDDLFGKV
jgi:hypothetical protein